VAAWSDRLRAAVDSVQQDPDGAARLATEALGAVEEPGERSLALWARGLARREMSDLPGARADLEAACELAHDAGDEHRWARAALSLSLVLANQGEPAEALALVEEVRPRLPPSEEALAVMQRGAVRYRLADFDGALRDYTWALPRLRRHGERLAELRLLVNLGSLHAYRRDFAAARRHLLAGQQLAGELGQTVLAGYTEHNLGHVEALRGDVPSALTHFAAAESLYSGLPGQREPLAILRADRARALLAANLVHESRLESDAALRLLTEGGNAADRADVALLAAEARLRDGDPAGAAAAARLARDELDSQQRTTWLPLVDLLELRAAGASATADDAERVVVALRDAGWSSEALAAGLILCQAHLRAGQVDVAVGLLRSLGRRTARMSPADLATSCLARAMAHYHAGARAAARRSVERGLVQLAADRLVLGTVELRAHAVASGASLATLGARLAVEDRRPRELLRRIESARGMSVLLRDPLVHTDDQLAALLAELRSLTEELRVTSTLDVRVDRLTKRRHEVEALIRDRARRTATMAEGRTLTVDDAVARLGDRRLLEYADLDGVLYAVSVARGRAQLHELGSFDDLQGDIDHIDFALHRLHRSIGSAPARRAARDVMTSAGERLQTRLLPERIATSDDPVLIVPTGRLHGLPWAVLPRLSRRAVSVAPSLVGWSAARRERTAKRSTALIAGPHLAGASAEVAALRAIHRRARVLDVGASTALRCTGELERASLVHFACHGSFRIDNPLFSTLHVTDGDLTVYDLERCRRLPETIVISACKAAQSSVLRGGGLLGMTSALLQLGVSSVIAPLTPVNDDESIELMVRLHTHLAAGCTPADALAKASVVDGELDTTAAAFVCVGG
jgi:tetratricopeptide (TPR) repeat protein